MPRGVRRAQGSPLDKEGTEGTEKDGTLSYLSVGVKEIAAPSETSRGEKARPSQIQSALREMKWQAGYSLLPKRHSQVQTQG